jgi:hypothetical protein
MDDTKNSTANQVEEDQTASPLSQPTDTKTKQTIPTLYPDIEYINRTLP